jgi:hypothetical protein
MFQLQYFKSFKKIEIKRYYIVEITNTFFVTCKHADEHITKIKEITDIVQTEKGDLKDGLNLQLFENSSRKNQHDVVEYGQGDDD